MAKLYNAETKKVEALPEDQLDSAIIQGTHSYAANEKINVVNPSGETVAVAAPDLKDALMQGYSIEKPKQAAVREYVEENKGLSGAAKVAVGKFGDEAVMGIPGIIYDKTGDPLEVAKWEALKKEHSAATAIGSTLGFAGSLLVGGPLFKGAAKAGTVAREVVAKQLAAAGIERGSESVAKRLVARMGEKATQLGVEGAVVSAPRAITEAALGDPEQAAESLLYGAGLGTVLGTAAGALEPAVGKVIQKFKDSLSESSLIKDFQNERAAKALGFTKAQIKKLKGGQDEAVNIAKDILDSRLESGERIITPLSDTGDIAKNVEKLRQEAGAKMERVFKTLDDKAIPSINPLEVASKIDGEIGNFWRSPINKAETNQLEATLESILVRGQKPISFAEAQALKEEIGKVAYPMGKNPPIVTPKVEIAQKAYRVVNEELDKAVDAAAGKIGDGSFLKELQDARRTYAISRKAGKALAEKSASEQGNKIFGLTDTIAGIGVGSGVGAIPAVATVFAKKGLEKYGNQIIATASVDGLLAAEQALKRVQAKLSKIPEAIEAMVPGGKSASRVSTVGAFSKLLQNTMHRNDAFSEVSRKITDPSANPKRMSDDFAGISSAFSNGGAPAVGNAFNLKMTQALQYLDANLPKPITPPNPFVKTKFKPSDADISAFERKLHTIMDPFSVIEDLKNGSVTKEQVDTLKAVYPKIYQQIQTRVIEHVSGSETTIPYQNRLKLSLLLDLPLDPSLSPDAIRSLQTTYLIEDHAPNQQNTNPNAPLNMSGRMAGV